ncbi:zinc finger protein 62-like [Battus philenor]|uniref:zinc finger protein 62-like n=1 Tax=Battus philenor TaxID=42288 RepID=UPI0035CFA568
MEPKLTNAKGLKTYSRRKSSKCVNVMAYKNTKCEPLTTKEAVKFLLQGSLKWRVCRFCLTSTTTLSELDEIYEVASSGAIFQVSIREMIASFYPFQIGDDPNFPNKICNPCLDRAINSYLFTQQCERSERALRNCFNDINEKFDKLDPIEKVKRRGRQKLNPNHNVLHVDYKKVISYADPIINLVNLGASVEESSGEIGELECPKCWQVLPNIESFVNHEKIHPKSMWFNCRLCGKSFIKHSQYKKHLKQSHASAKSADVIIDKKFTCNECGSTNEDYDAHLQHVEKHKFKYILEHLIERKMGDLCGVCMEKGSKMVELNETFYLHGGYPELTGEKTLATVLSSSIPEINTLHNYTGTKICEKCLNNALTSYIFVSKIRYLRNRLHTCISLMLESLDQIDDPENNVMVEIALDTILPLAEKINDLEEDNDSGNESKLKIDVLEDEFRIQIDSSEEESVKSDEITIDEYKKQLFDELKKTIYPIKTETDTVKDTNKTVKLINGYQSTKYNNEVTPVKDVCSEFLTFKKKKKSIRRKPKYTCPFCGKHFISDYFVKKHILKHVYMKIKCDICNEEFKSKFHLFEHKKISHASNNDSYVTCKTCDRGFKDNKKLLIHKRNHKKNICPLCSKMFISQSRFESHFQRHALKFKLHKNYDVQTCSFCEKEASNENELSLHVNKSHLQIKPYNCDMCDKKFYTEYNLSSHKTVHSFYSKENCEFCDKVLNSRRDLVVHVRKHIGSKPHHCHVCRQSFYSEISQSNHMRKVHGGRFCCRLCKSMFNRKVDLKAHVNVAHNAI